MNGTVRSTGFKKNRDLHDRDSSLHDGDSLHDRDALHGRDTLHEQKRSLDTTEDFVVNHAS